MTAVGSRLPFTWSLFEGKKKARSKQPKSTVRLDLGFAQRDSEKGLMKRTQLNYKKEEIEMGMIQDFQEADKERRGEVKQLQREVASMLKDFAKGDTERRSEVATTRSGVATMVKDLAKGSAQRHSDLTVTLRDLAAQAEERRAEVAGIAKEAAAILKEADAFVKDLAKGSAQRRSKVASMLGEFAQGDAERRSDVATIHEMVWGKAPARKMAAPAVEELPKEMPPEAPVGELRDRVFAYLADHPDGTRLTELEEAFGIARVQIARVIRGLIDNNKVDKRDLLYFAI